MPDQTPIQQLLENITNELSFNTTRSSGPGGQHVNKTETRVEVYWDLANSPLLTDEQREMIAEKLANHIDKDGVLRASTQQTRSQGRNKELAIAKMLDRIAKALHKKKPRKKRKPIKAAIEARIKKKKQLSQKKQLRKPPPIN